MTGTRIFPGYLIDLLPEPLNVGFETKSFVEIRREDREKEDALSHSSRLHPNWLEKSKIRTCSYPTTRKQTYLLYIFLEALDGLELNRCKRCAECNQWFFKLSNHKRIFCSNRCAAKKGAKNKRAHLKESDPEAHKQYREKGAERARKSYKKKVKKIHPSAKVDRRPTKHKKGLDSD